VACAAPERDYARRVSFRSSLDAIEIRGLRVGCVVGVRPDERLGEQPLDLDLRLLLDLRRAGRSGRIGDTCDYDQVAEQVHALLKFRRYRLLEAAAEEIAAMLLGVHRTVLQVEVRLEKPRALLGRAQGASVKIRRRTEDLALREERTDFGRAQVLLETQDAGLYLLHIDPGASIPPHRHEVMRELEWRVAGDLERCGRPMTGLSPMEWPRGHVHGYRNLGTAPATLFCCDVPPFDPADEIRVDGAGEGMS